jgi:hypothetical protein
MQQEQLDSVNITVTDIIPVLPDPCACYKTSTPCNCTCCGNTCNCTCGCCGGTLTYADALATVENSCGCPLPTPNGQWIFDSCRSSTTAGRISNLSIDRQCDRPQFARIKCTVDLPVDILFHDESCQAWMGHGVVTIDKDVLLAIPDESIVPFTLESLVSAIAVTGKYIGNCQFQVTICVTVILKILAEVELMIPTYGFCSIPPCEEFAENVCDEFFSLPLFPQQSCVAATATGNCSNNIFSTTGCTTNTTSTVGGCSTGTCSTGNCSTQTCGSCGTTCGAYHSSCPRCGRTI